MKFYQSISPYYDKIFKSSQLQKEFILSSEISNPKTVNALEIGCGTGNLTIGLSNSFKRIVGIDQDGEMLKIALSKLPSAQSNIILKCLSMMDIKRTFSPRIFSLVFLFGNTLVHLPSLDLINNFLRQAKNVLADQGILLIQIVNYDRIIKENVTSLPIIENETLKFTRYYQYIKQKNRIQFKTILKIKKTNTTITDMVELYPLLKEELTRLLEKNDYSDIHFFGGFDRSHYTVSSPPLIVEAKNS